MISPHFKIVPFNMRDIIRPPFPLNPPPNPAEEPDEPQWDYTLYDNRLATYFPNWPVDFLSPEDMANAGFYYTGVRDKVRCMYCLNELNNWQPTDVPIEEHRRNSPQCAFFRQDQGSYFLFLLLLLFFICIIIIVVVFIARDVCGIFNPPQRNFDFDDHVIKLRLFLTAWSVEQKNTIVPNNKAFTSIENRLRSFENCARAINQDIYTLCLSGLYYMGILL